MANALKRFRGGIKASHCKKTSEFETVRMPLPSKVVIPMLQHIGAPCTPLVKKGDSVLVGQKIGDSDSVISAPVHSSVSGAVTEVRPMLYPGGFEVISVEIEPDGQQKPDNSIAPVKDTDRESIIKSIRESGIVGLGGAGFPTAVKLSPPPGKKLDTLIVNGAECEPYITSDYREMMENPQSVLRGTRILMELAQIPEAYIGIESNKPGAIQRLSELAREFHGIKVVSLPERYPQGGEKQLIYAVTGRRVPQGGLPSHIGVLVHNVNTVSNIAEYISTGMPLIKKRVTVEGAAVAKPMNLEVLIGTSLREVFEFCGGFKEKPAKIIMGGPMMGVAQFSLDNPVVKHTNALLAFNQREAYTCSESVCIRCGKCVSACPMGLLPLYISANIEIGRVEETLKYHVDNCIECGCCSYVCPASRYLVQSIRYAKAELKRRQTLKQEGAIKNGV